MARVIIEQVDWPNVYRVKATDEEYGTEIPDDVLRRWDLAVHNWSEAQEEMFATWEQQETIVS